VTVLIQVSEWPCIGVFWVSILTLFLRSSDSFFPFYTNLENSSRICVLVILYVENSSRICVLVILYLENSSRICVLVIQYVENSRRICVLVIQYVENSSRICVLVILLKFVIEMYTHVVANLYITTTL
jgi:hypothetical protein